MARVNTNQPPSQLDWENLETIRKEEKVKILYFYLYENGNMADVATEVFGKSEMTESNNVSNVMRCYGFSGRNSGHFSKKLNYELDINDFREFVNKYPKGCRGDWPEHRTIDEFMRKKHLSKVNRNISGYADKQQDFGDTFISQRNKHNSDINQEIPITDDEALTYGILGVVGLIFIISIIRFIINRVRELPDFFHAIGLWGIGAMVCFLGAIFLLIKSIVLKELRKSLKILVPMFAVGFLFAAIADGDFMGIVKSIAVAVIGYYFGLGIEHENDKG